MEGVLCDLEPGQQRRLEDLFRVGVLETWKAPVSV